MHICLSSLSIIFKLNLVQNYFNHPLLKEDVIKFRQYQQDIVSKSLYENSLIVVPTSLGKTIVALLVCLDILLNWKDSKILILAPTRPLVFQHFELFKNCTYLSDYCIALTGKISPGIRKTMWKSRSIRVYFATPELVKNDIKEKILKKDEFYLIVFDEAQRAVKDYSYTFISKKFYENLDHEKFPLILALSASPGASETKIKEICSNLFIEQIIVKSERDEDVLPYIYNTDVEHCLIEINDYHRELSKLLSSLIQETVGWLITNKFIKKKKVESVYRKDLLSLGDYIKSKLDSKNTNFFLLAALKYQSLSMILLYCRDLVESQGSFALKKFLDKVQDKSYYSKTYQELFSDSRIKKIVEILRNHSNETHPKLEKVLSIINHFLESEKNEKIVENSIRNISDTIASTHQSHYESLSNNNQKKVLVFTQYRDTLEEITNFLDYHGISCKGFYGQSNKNGQRGLSQDKQLSLLDDFRLGIFPVLVATSVAEEGLNIPNVDLVLFYEPVPSEIRFIQRKGRTGRFSNGRVIILISKNSVDSKYLEVSQRKIDKMKSSLQNTNFTLNHYNKRPFDIYEKMLESDLVFSIEKSKIDSGFTEHSYFKNTNPIIDSISSNSNKKIKHFVRKLSYRPQTDNNNSGSCLSFTKRNLEDLYEISLNLDERKIVGKVQRQIHNLLAQAGKNGLEVLYLNEIIRHDHKFIKKAIENLEKMKRIVWLNRNTVASIDSVKFLPGTRYSIFVDKILQGRAIVIVNDKWYAFLEHHEYSGPRSLLKKGNVFNIIGEMYRRDGKLYLKVKKII